MKIDKKYINKFQELCLDEFKEQFEFFYHKHYCEVRDYNGKPYPEKMYEELDEYHKNVIIGNIFEDLMTQDVFYPNSLDVYLEQNKDMPQRERAYFAALRHSVMSYYEVIDVTPGESVTVKDVLREMPLQTVLEESGTRLMKPGMIFGARIVSVEGTAYFTGVLMPHISETSLHLAKRTVTLGSQNKEFLSDSNFTKKTPIHVVKTEILKDMVAAFSWMYLDTVFEKMQQAKNHVYCTNDGELLLGCQTAFVFNAKNRKAIAERLDAHPNLVCVLDDRKWCWVGDEVEDIEAEAKKNKLHEDATLSHIVFVIGPDGERYVSRGDICLKKKELVLETLSKERNSEGELMLTELVGDLANYNGTHFTHMRNKRD